METKEIQEIMEKCLSNLDEESLAVVYKDAITDYLKDNKVNDDIVTIIIKGTEIDRAAILFDYLESVPKNEVSEVWKVIKKNSTFKANFYNNSVKILSGMISMSLTKSENIMAIAAGVFNLYIGFLTAEKKPIAYSVYKDILVDYCLEELPKKDYKFAEWKDLNIAPKVAKQFIEIVTEILEREDGLRDLIELKRWLKVGSQEIEVLLEQERIEAKIPKSRIEDLKDLLDHYTLVEQSIRDAVYREEKLNCTIEGLNNEIDELHKQKAELSAQIRDLNSSMAEQSKYLAEADKEITERKNLNDAFDALKKNDEGALLKDIANELRAEYLDFMDSEKDEMDIQLGEIYREKIRNIFRILSKKGIKVD